MNVLFVAHSVTMNGGANRSMFQLILELRKNHNINPIVLIPTENKTDTNLSLESACQKEGIEVIRTIIPWFYHPKVWLHRAKYVVSLFQYPSLVNRLRKKNIALIHSNGSIIDLGCRLSKSLGVPHVWHLREFGTESGTFKDVLWKSYRQNIYKKPSTFIAISDAIKKHYIDSNLIQDEHIVRIYNGISLDMYKELSTHQNDITKIALVGVITPHKNQFEAAKAVKILIDRGQQRFKLYFIGNDKSEYANEIKGYVNNNSLNEYIEFMGVRKDVPRILNHMDIGLMLSRSEAFGRVTVEYMFQNLAVIASDTGANLELIVNGKTGLIYKFGDYNALADCIDKLILNKEMMINIAESGRSFALNTFPSGKNSDAVYELYKKLLNI